METSSRQYLSRSTSFVRGGPSYLDRMFHSLSGASRCSDYAEVSRVIRLSQHTCLASCRQTPSAVCTGCRTSGTAPIPGGGADAIVGLQIHRFVPRAPPLPFHKHVVPPAACAVHTDPDAMVFQAPCEPLVGELAALVDIEDVRSAIAG